MTTINPVQTPGTNTPAFKGNGKLANYAKRFKDAYWRYNDTFWGRIDPKELEKMMEARKMPPSKRGIFDRIAEKMEEKMPNFSERLVSIVKKFIK